MVNVLHFYLDDSGTRHPDHDPGAAALPYDWFALGGVLVRQEDEKRTRRLHEQFCNEWSITTPLHSYDIRHMTEDFRWLRGLDRDGFRRFQTDLSRTLCDAPLVGLACVIDRPGYNARYKEQYRDRWLLCKTAFDVAVERAAKYAASINYKLKVFVERGDPGADTNTRTYYDAMRKDGMPFDAARSEKYQPLTAAQLSSTLYEFRIKRKSSPIMQLADLYLFPIALGGYQRDYLPYRILNDQNKLMDNLLSGSDVASLGIKYSCWDLVGKGS